MGHWKHCIHYVIHNGFRLVFSCFKIQMTLYIYNLVSNKAKNPIEQNSKYKCNTGKTHVATRRKQMLETLLVGLIYSHLEQTSFFKERNSRRLPRSN